MNHTHNFRILNKNQNIIIQFLSNKTKTRDKELSTFHKHVRIAFDYEESTGNILKLNSWMEKYVSEMEQDEIEYFAKLLTKKI